MCEIGERRSFSFSSLHLGKSVIKLIRTKVQEQNIVCKKKMLLLNQDGDIIIMVSYEILISFITCEKVISKPPKRSPKDENKYWRSDMELTTTDGEEHFFVFIRKSQELPDNFSIGLQWHCRENGKRITLFRCNGPHGGNRKFTWHYKPHTHLLSEEYYNAEMLDHPTDVNTDVCYSTFDEAIAFFCGYCGIQNADKYFPQILNISLFPDEH